MAQKINIVPLVIAVVTVAMMAMMMMVMICTSIPTITRIAAGRSTRWITLKDT